jgi:hypothetical protein
MTTQVSSIHLLDVASDQLVEAELRDAIEEAQIVDWQTKWQPALVTLLQELARKKVPIADWPENWHWNWAQKTAQVAGLLGFHGFCIVCAGVTQGLMRVDLTKSARAQSQKGKPLVYIDYLEVAPWNRAEFGSPPRLRGTGTALMLAATELSNQEGFKGRIGLHSLPRANDFYRTNCGMADLGPDPACQNLNYFELTPEQAATLLAKED